MTPSDAESQEEATSDEPLAPEDDLRVQPPRLHPGARLGRYLLDRPISSRIGKASVWRAKNTEEDRVEVLKIYLLADRERSLRIAEESRMALRWSASPTIVTTYRTEAIDAYWVIAMEEMGETLEGHIRRQEEDPEGGCDFVAYAGWIAHVGAALFAIHNAGDLHRDITASNVMLDRTGTVAKLMDFSIGRTKDDSVRKATEEGVIKGTPRFLAPEQYDNDDTPYSDQYQLGVLAWMLFSGAGMGRDPLGRLTRPIRVVLERATAVRPEDRFPNVPSFTAALKVAVAGSTSRTAVFLKYPPSGLRRILARLGTLPAMAAIITYVAYGLAPGVNEIDLAVGVTAINAGLFGLAIVIEAALLWNVPVNTDDRGGLRAILPLHIGVLLALGAGIFTVANGRPLDQPLIVGSMPALAYVLGNIVYAAALGAVSRYEARYVISYLEGLLGLRRPVTVWACRLGTIVALLGYYLIATHYISQQRLDAITEGGPPVITAPAIPGRGPQSIAVQNSGPTDVFLQTHPRITIRLGFENRVVGLGNFLRLGKTPDLGLFESTFGRPATRRPSAGGCIARWPKLGLEVHAANLGGADPCGSQTGLIQTFALHGASAWRWSTPRGLRVGAGAERLRRLYPGARIGRFTQHVPLEEAQSPFGSSGFAEVLGVDLIDGRVSAMTATIGAAGE
jgi:tRNA A-37 threonylcarbamoyl transferase component Bud32